MRPIVLIAGLAALIAAPTASQAACKTTGTLVGAGIGGLLGNAVASRGVKTEGAVLGAGVGAVVGNQVARSRCGNSRAAARNRNYQRSSYTRPASRTVRDRDDRYAAYDSRQGAACRYETKQFYNGYGELVSAPTRVCGN